MSPQVKILENHPLNVISSPTVAMGYHIWWRVKLVWNRCEVVRPQWMGLCYVVAMKRHHTFGDWIRSQLDPNQITIINLSDYSGLHIRKLYRIINGENTLRWDDWIWIIECVGDMTNQSMTDLVIDCVEYMNPPKSWDTMRYECCVVCGCDPCDCHPNGEDDGSKYIYIRSSGQRSNRESDTKVYRQVWDGQRSSNSGGHSIGIVRTLRDVWSSYKQTQKDSRPSNPSDTIGGVAIIESHEKKQPTEIHSDSREHRWRYLWQSRPSPKGLQPVQPLK